MAKCPKCGKKIDYLWMHQQAKIIYRFTEYGYEREGVYPDDIKTKEYYCPECNELLFTSGEAAKRFLIGSF